MASPAEASGRAFLGLIRHVKDSRGDRGLAAIVRDAGEPTENVFRSKIRVAGWYPYASFSGFLAAADRALGKGDGQSCRALGAAAGKRDLTTILRVYVALASVERLIRSCEKIWPSYYRNAGRMEALTWHEDNTVLRIYDFPDMHPAHCRLMEGWMITTMATIGFHVNNDAMETACTSNGDPYHEFRCSWTRGQPR
jgi:hypothetical protein